MKVKWILFMNKNWENKDGGNMKKINKYYG